MLSAMSEEDIAFRGNEQYVVAKDTSQTLREDIEARYAFVGGPKDEYVSYFHRADDRTAQLWRFLPVARVRVYADFRRFRRRTHGSSANC